MSIPALNVVLEAVHNKPTNGHNRPRNCSNSVDTRDYENLLMCCLSSLSAENQNCGELGTLPN